MKSYSYCCRPLRDIIYPDMDYPTERHSSYLTPRSAFESGFDHAVEAATDRF